MKEGWTYKKIKDVGEVIGGTTPSTTNPEFWGGDICWISPAELHGDHYLYDSVKKITPKAVSAKSLKELPVGTVILSSRAPIGKIAINKVPMYCNQGFKCVVCGPELYNEFLYWWFYGKVDYLNSLGTGATFKEISKTVVENIVVPIAPLEEQKRIVERLDAAFENIDKLKANAENQLAEARTLFQKSLAKAMKPKEGWEEKTMSEITEVKDGTHDSPKYVTEGIPFVTQKNITINGFDLINTKKITLEDHKKFYTRSNVEFGDIIIAMIGANRGMSCIVNTREIFSIKNVGLIKKTDNINMRFLLYYLHSPAANSYVLENSNGGAQEFIGLKGLRNFPIQFPPLAEQQRIVERLDALSENIRKYEEIQRQIISECDALKQALLRKVFE